MSALLCMTGGIQTVVSGAEVHKMNIPSSRIVAVLGVVVALVAGLAIRVAPASSQVADRVAFVNAIPDSTLSLTVDGVVVDADVAYRDTVLVAADSAGLGAWEAVDTATNTALAADDAFLPESGSWTLVAHRDTSGGSVVTYIPNAVEAVGEGNARVAVYHTAAGNDHYAVRVAGETITPAGGLAAGERSLTTLNAGTYELSIVNIDTNAELSPPSVLVLEPQTVTNAFVIMPDATLDVVTATAPVDPSGPQAPDYCHGEPVTVSLERGEVPTAGADVILGTSDDDVIAAGSGDDIICGRGGDDRIWGQDGNDYIEGGSGKDTLRGGEGDDELYGGFGQDDLNGGRGNDLVRAEEGNDIAVRGGTGDDLVDGGTGDDALVAGNGGYDVVMGGPGNDALVSGGARPDQVFGGQGDDLLRGLGGADKIFGGAGNDVIYGGKQGDFVDGGPDTDACNGGSENDRGRCEELSPNVETAVPAAIDYAKLNEIACEGSSAVTGATCYWVTVPEDFTDPANGRTVALYTVYVDNGDPDGRGPVLRLSGDAGSYDGSLSVAAFAGTSTDALAIDLRGTGRSVPSLDCPEVSDLFYELKAMTYRQAQAATRAGEAKCLERLEAAGVEVDAFTTAARVHDIEIVRDLLNLKSVNLWADNYGTRLGAALLRENPDPYRAIMFTNVLPLDVSQLATAEANTERALRRLFAACDANPDCRSQYGDLSSRLEEILAWLADTPQTVPVTDLDGEVFDALVEPDKYLYSYLAAMLNSDATIAEVPGALDAAWNGDVATLAQRIEAVPPGSSLVVSEGATLAVTCYDEAWVARIDPRCDGWFDGSGIVTDSSAAPWPNPTAILAGTLDPVTPSDWAAATATLLPNAALAEFTNSGRRIVGACPEGILASMFTAYPTLPDVGCATQGTDGLTPVPTPRSSALRPGDEDATPERPTESVAAIVEGFGYETK